MKGLKFAVAAAAAVGLIGLFVPFEIMPGMSISLFKGMTGPGGEAWRAYLLTAGFAIALVVAILGIAKGPFKAPLAGAALGGFAAAAISLPIWKAFKGFGDAPLMMKLVPLAVVAGLIVAGLAVAKPEE